MGTYTRDFSFTEDGKACTSNNPLPMAALEGGVGEIVCIEIMEEAPLITPRLAGSGMPSVNETL